MRQVVSLALMTGFLALQPLKAEVLPCAGADGKTLPVPKPCTKADKLEKKPNPSSPQQYKAALKANAERPSDQDEPPERENRHPPEATQAPQRQQDMDGQMFRR